MSKEETKPAIKQKSAAATRAAITKTILANLEGIARLGVGDQNLGFWSTGHFNLDFAITQGTLPVKCDLSKIEDFDPAEPGGVPKGKVVEIFGEPGGGKSSLCLRIVGNAQKRGAVCVWVDREQSFVKSLAKINGVDTESLIMVDDASLSAEQVFHHCYKLVESGADVIVIDSVAALIPQRVMDNTDPEQQNVALLARVMGQCVPKLTSLCAKHNCTVIFINQIRQKPGVVYGPSETTPGGETLKFMSSVRLQITKMYAKDAEVYREDENGIQQLIAQKSRVAIRKTRFSKGLRESIEVPVYFAPFFPNPEEVAFDLGRQTQVIRVRNGVFLYKYGEKKIEVEGRKSFIAEMVSQQLVPALIADIKDAAEEKGVVLPPELMSFTVVGGDEVIKKDAVQSTESVLINEYLEDQAKKDEAEATNETTDVPRTPKKKAGRVRTTDSLD